MGDLGGKRLEALRACRATPQGLRQEAYPSVMPELVDLGLVEAKRALGPGKIRPAWFLTKSGRKALKDTESTRTPHQLGAPRRMR